MNDKLFEIVLASIPVIMLVVTGYVVPFVKTKIDAEKLATIVKWVSLAVKAAEQVYNETKQGVTKKQYVVDFINGKFNSKKVVITEDQIKVLLEAAVNELKK